MDRTQDKTSEALLLAAHRLLKEQGADALTVRRIATEAGMSTMNVYSRFGGKDGVVDELYVEGFKRLFAAIDGVPTTDEPAEDLMEAARKYRDFALENPAYYGIMFRRIVHGYDPSPDAVETALSGLMSFVERVRLAQQHGQIIGDEIGDPIEIAAWLWAACHGLVSLELTGTGAERIVWSNVFEHGMHTAIAGLHPSLSHRDA